MDNLPYQYEMSITVPAEDIDEMAHVNNVAYLRYAEAIARAHAESVGLGYEGCLALGGVWVVRRHEVTYHRPAHVGDRLVLRTRIRESRGVRAVREIRILRAGELLVDVDTHWVWLDPETRAPKRIPKEVEKRLPVQSDIPRA